MTPRRWLIHFAAALLLALTPVLRAQPEEVVTVSIVPDRTAVRPGDQVAIAVIFDHQPGWHIHTNDPKPPPEWQGFIAIPAEVEPSKSDAVTFGRTQWPRPHTITVDLSGGTGKPAPYDVFADRAVVFLPAVIAPDASGKLSLSFRVAFQACDDRSCQQPVDAQFPLELQVLAPGDPAPQPNQPELFAGFDRTAFAAMSGKSAEDTSLTFPVFGKKLTIDTAGFGLVLLLLLSALGGFLLNLTPCVLPVIPLKIMGLSHHAGNPVRARVMGLIMCIGVVAFWATIGLMMVSLTNFKAINQLFQQPVFTIGVGVFILIMAVGMLGIFNVRLPNFVYMIDPKSDTVPGSFLFGVMTAVLSTPCTAPFMGTAAAWATKQSTTLTLAVFASIGVGMAAPYLILAFFPRLLASVPKSGPGSELIKQVMGLLMIAVAVFFLGTGIDPLARLPVDPPIRWFWWVILAFVVISMGWLVVRTLKFSRGTGVRTCVALLALAFSTVTLLVVRHVTDLGPIKWVGYTPQRLQEAISRGKVVVIDFTAEWCLNCKALEAGVLHREEIYNLMNSDAIVPFKADMTGKNADAQAKLNELKWVGIPLLVVHGPGLKEPLLFDSYTPQVVKDAINQAAGKQLASPK